MDDIVKLLIPAAVALVSWFIKDFIVSLITKRNEAIHREWEYRLKEVWSPLYYWSGVILFDSNAPDGAKHGLKELENILSKCAYLVPIRQYYTLIKLVEKASGQKTKPLTGEEVVVMREYLYNQIELLNYLLYRSSEINDVSVKTNLLSPYKYLLRMVSIGIIHVIIWAAVACAIGGCYWLYSHSLYWALGIIALILAIIVVVDMRRRNEIGREMEKRLLG